MYCVNCGKRVDGTIPICPNCALLVLSNKPEEVLAQKVASEAEEFKIMSDINNNTLDQQLNNNTNEPLKDAQADDESFPWFVLGILIFIVCVFIISINM